MTDITGPGIYCDHCGAPPDEPHGGECPVRETGPVWPGTTDEQESDTGLFQMAPADDQEGSQHDH